MNDFSAKDIDFKNGVNASTEGKMLVALQHWNPESEIFAEILVGMVGKDNIAIRVFADAQDKTGKPKKFDAPPVSENDLKDAAYIVADVPSELPKVTENFARMLHDNVVKGSEAPIRLMSGAAGGTKGVAETVERIFTSSHLEFPEKDGKVLKRLSEEFKEEILKPLEDRRAAFKPEPEKDTEGKLLFLAHFNNPKNNGIYQEIELLTLGGAKPEDIVRRDIDTISVEDMNKAETVFIDASIKQFDKSKIIERLGEVRSAIVIVSSSADAIRDKIDAANEQGAGIEAEVIGRMTGKNGIPAADVAGEKYMELRNVPSQEAINPEHQGVINRSHDHGRG